MDGYVDGALNSSVNALEILPAEMWTEVLSNLDEDDYPRDFTNASETCLLFRNLLSHRSNGFKEVLPLVLQWLPKADVLNCRLLSKRITTCVDRILCNKHQIKNIRHFGLYRKLDMWRIPSKRFAEPLQREQLTPIFRFNNGGLFLFDYTNEFSMMGVGGTGTTKEFPGRRLRYSQFNIRNNVDQLGLLSDSLDMLKLPVLRHWIGHLKMYGEYNGSDAVLMYESVRQLFGYLKNLEVFVMEIEVQNGSGSWEQESLAELEGYIEGHPLPVMPCLRRIVFKGKFPGRCFGEICRKYGDQLNGLEMGAGPTVGDHSFPVLKQLRIHGLRDNRPLPRFEAPKVDHLELECLARRTREEAAALLEDFPNLKTLVFWQRFEVGGILGPKESLQHVKHLHLRHYCDLQYPVRFLASCFPGLETLNIEINFLDGWPMVSRECQADWELLCEGRGYELGIWEASSLQSLNVKMVGIPGGGHEEFDDIHLTGNYTRMGFMKKKNRGFRRVLRRGSLVFGLNKCFGINKLRRNDL